MTTTSETLLLIFDGTTALTHTDSDGEQLITVVEGGLRVTLGAGYRPGADWVDAHVRAGMSMWTADRIAYVFHLAVRHLARRPLWACRAD